MSSRILFCAHDPGGANAILPVVQLLQKGGEEVHGYTSGPAKSIFSAANIPFTDSESLSDTQLEQVINTIRPQVMLAGRSVQYTHDKRMLPMLRERNIPSLYVLDFWNYYWQWFSEGEKDFKFLPDIICVMDESAREEMVREGFPPKVIRVTGNPYFEHFAENIFRTNENPEEVVFISQPIRDITPLHEKPLHGFDELEVLTDLQEAFKAMPKTYTLRIRLHPKDDIHKYDRYLDNRTTISSSSLEECVSSAGLVIGMFSPVLMQAAAAGKSVISYEPNLVGYDPLPTNALGITHRATDNEALKTLLDKYEKGTLTHERRDFYSIWPPGAGERIVEELMRLLK